ncbi:MAG: ArgR family transcriptional regulator [Spirochaetia bacterium]|nr:ArgR family transcriptional regulator [Spirochaetia bacterium]
MDKKTRLNLIRNLIISNSIENQEQLQALLAERNIDVTQATLSRDLKTLKVSKSHHPQGGYFYTVSEGENRRGSTDNFIGDISRGFVSMNFSGNLGVIKTLPGYANTVALVFDRLNLPEILGTVAGDDTIIFVIREGVSKEALKARLREKFPSLYI